MLIQQRQPYKRSWAGLWDVSVGGCALAGESSREAAEREAREELGYSLSLQDVAPALTLYPRGVLNDVYLVERQIDLSALTLQPEEVRSVKWATEKKIKNMIDEGTFYPLSKGLYFFASSFCAPTKTSAHGPIFRAAKRSLLLPCLPSAFGRHHLPAMRAAWTAARPRRPLFPGRYPSRFKRTHRGSPAAMRDPLYP